MKLTYHLILIFFMLIGGNNLYANDTPVEFNDPALKERYFSLIEEVRCLVCQNQSLADSHADLAVDLRNEIYEMVVANKSNQQIVEFLVERYGDFVLYRPPLQGNTWILWFGPFLLLIIAVVIAIRIISKQSNENDTKMSRKEQERLNEILNNKPGKGES